MDGPQSRYQNTLECKEHVVDKLSEPDSVRKRAQLWYYDEKEQLLYIHTSDGKPPTTHEIELAYRPAGFQMLGKRYVTITGFTFRHFQDTGITFFKGSHNGIAFDNVSYGSRQGIRVYGSKDCLIYDNTFFRNENSGVYFAAESTNGVAIGNTSYENIKGVRWSSKSANAVVLDNIVFDNKEAGVSIENAEHGIVRRNRSVNNAVAQFQVFDATFSSEDNCFENGAPDQMLAAFEPIPASWDRFKTLEEYQNKKHQDMHSRGGKCGKLPAKLDVHKLQADSEAYAEKARKMLLGVEQKK